MDKEKHRKSLCGKEEVTMDVKIRLKTIEDDKSDPSSCMLVTK